MKSITAAVAAVLVAFAVAMAPAAASATDETALSPAQKQEIETLVRDYLMAHPEVIGEAIEALREKQRVAQETRAKAALTANRAALFDDADSPVVGNTAGDVTVVEFFDYQCGYCKRVFPSLMKSLKDDGGVRLVLKEFPILGPQSRYAATAALAARKQGKYSPFHMALMSVRGALTEETVDAVARSVGLDIPTLKNDMSDPAIRKAIEKNFALASALDIRGTPAFVIGDQLVPGAIDLETLRNLISEARGKS